MRRSANWAIAVGCGVIGASLYLTVTLGTPGALLLVYMTQLPLFVAGLWLGAPAVVVAGLTATLVLLAASDLLAAVLFVAVNAAPVALIVRQALLARPGSNGAVVWYPPGLLTAWATALALAGILAALVLLGGPRGLQAALQDVVGEVLDRLSRRPLPHRDQAAATLAMVIPGIVAASWMIMLVINAALAQGLLSRFGLNWRPSPELTALSLPAWLPAALGLAAAAMLFEGALRFLGINTLIVLIVPFCLAGLAVLHVAVRRLSHPVMALFGFYAAGALFGWPFLAVAVLGLLESWLGLRRRLAASGS